MDRFQELTTFCAVVDGGSFVKAAQALGMSKAAVSRHVGSLETRLGVRLLHRTTRRLSLTAEGVTFDARSREVLAGLESAESEISSRDRTVRGLLRITAPISFGIRHLAPLWGEFCQRYPQIELEVELADRLVDPVEEGYDLAVRIATLPGSTLIGKRLATTRLVLCASPVYLEAHGMPRHPHEIAGHQVISYSYFSTRDQWQFEGPGGPASVNTRPRFHTNNGDTCRAAALAHQGIVLQPTFLVGDELASGALVELMPEYRAASLGIHALYPSRKHVAPKVRAIVDFLSERLAQNSFG